MKLSLAIAALAATANAADQVNILVCVEAYCPGCESFTVSDLYPTYQKEGMADIMNITFVPYGNANMVGDKLTCQHGEDECSGNSYEQCAIHLYPDVADHLPFVYCFANENHGSGAPDSAMEKCAGDSNLDFSKIKECHDDADLSLELQKAAAAATPDDHEYTPWVVINGEVFESSFRNKFINAVCDAYTGDKPAACSKKVVEQEDLKCYKSK